jgi:hypothetical protein
MKNNTQSEIEKEIIESNKVQGSMIANKFLNGEKVDERQLSELMAKLKKDRVLINKLNSLQTKDSNFLNLTL